MSILVVETNGLAAADQHYQCIASKCCTESVGLADVLPKMCSFASSEYPPLRIHEGYYREEAILWLRRFYLRENDHGTCHRSDIISDVAYLSIT